MNENDLRSASSVQEYFYIELDVKIDIKAAEAFKKGIQSAVEKTIDKLEERAELLFDEINKQSNGKSPLWEVSGKFMSSFKLRNKAIRNQNEQE